jgi:hypothetical protein
MEDNVQKELDSLKGMVLRWKENYLSWVPPDGGGEFLVEEFSEELHTHIHHYVRRLYQCNHLDYGEYQEFIDFCHSQIEELRSTVGRPEEDHKEGFWHMLADG